MMVVMTLTLVPIYWTFSIFVKRMSMPYSVVSEYTMRYANVKNMLQGTDLLKIDWERSSEEINKYITDLEEYASINKDVNWYVMIGKVTIKIAEEGLVKYGYTSARGISTFMTNDDTVSEFKPLITEYVKSRRGVTGNLPIEYVIVISLGKHMGMFALYTLATRLLGESIARIILDMFKPIASPRSDNADIMGSVVNAIASQSSTRTDNQVPLVNRGSINSDDV